MSGKAKRYVRLFISVSLIFMLGGCSVFISTPQVTRIQIQGVDDQLREYIVTLDEPGEDNVGIRLSDRYTIQFDFEWLWNSEAGNDIYLDLNPEYGEPDMAPWMLCKYNF